MKKKDRMSAFMWGALGIYITYAGYSLGLGSLGRPKEGFLIFWSGIILAGLSFFLFLQTFWQTYEKKENQGSWKGLRWDRNVKLMLSLIIYAFLFKTLGFIISTFLLLLYLFKGLVPQKWSTALVLSISTIAVCYVVFGVFLEMQFPSGILGGLLIH